MTEAEAMKKMVPPGQRRKGPWRDGVLQIQITRACTESCYGCTQASNLAGKPAMMTPAQFEKACQSLEGYFGVVGVFGGDPCLAGETKVLTGSGIFPIKDLAEKMFLCRTPNGEMKPAYCWKSGHKRLYKITLRGGHEIFATEDHLWPAFSLRHGKNHKRKDIPGYSPRKSAVSLGKLKTTQLEKGCYLPIFGNGSLVYGWEGSRMDGFVAGWLTGDGWVIPGKPVFDFPPRKNGKIDKRSVRFGERDLKCSGFGFIVNREDADSGIADAIQNFLISNGSNARFRKEKDNCIQCNTVSMWSDSWMKKYGISTKNNGIPTSCWSSASDEFRKGFIDGLFSSDGNVEISKKSGHARIRLTTAHEKIARDVCDLLSFYGIKTAIQKRVRSRGSFPNGKDYGKSYTSYQVSIESQLGIERFASEFRLTHKSKRERIESVVGKHKKDCESEFIEVQSVETTDRIEDVWDISVADSSHSFQISHCVTGNCLSPHFEEICEILCNYFPFEQRGLWSNDPVGKAKICRKTFNPAVSNINVHLKQKAYDEFCREWPEVKKYIIGKDEDSRHGPPFVAMKDVGMTDEEIYEKAAGCDVNQNWSALIGVVRGKLKAYVCELMYTQATIHENDQDWPDLGMDPVPGWWRLPMEAFADQVKFHCGMCGMPLRGFGDLAIGGSKEQVSKSHHGWFRPKTPGRPVELVTSIEQIHADGLKVSTNYLQNSDLPILGQ